MFNRILVAVEETEGDLKRIPDQWEIIYRYLECLNAEIQAHKMHLYVNDDTSNAISILNTANGAMLNFALVNYSEVEAYTHLKDRFKLQEVLSEIKDNTLQQLDLVLDSMQNYYDLISDINSSK